MRCSFLAPRNPASATLNIVLPIAVGWERRLDWTEISFQARINSRAGQSRIVAGRCWNWNVAVCAKQIADAAAGIVAS